MLIDSLAAVVAQHADDPLFFRSPGARTADRVVAAARQSQADMPEVFPQAPLGDAVRILSGNDDFANSRTAIVAQWAEDGVIAPYLVHYLHKLREAGMRVILACGVVPYADSGWFSLCDAVIARTCSGYDFTSWRAAFEIFPSLYRCREVVCTNDSIFGPIHPLGDVHRVMDGVPCDFWGLVESREKQPHLQSYYLVFRKKTLRHPVFAAFWSTVDRSGEKFDTVLRYEVTLSLKLAAQGLRPGAFVPAAALPETNINPSHYFWRQLLSIYKAPFIKRDLLRHCAKHPHLAGWRELLDAAGYDSDLVFRTPNMFVKNTVTAAEGEI